MRSPGLVAECDALAAGAHLQDVQGTPYLELPDPAAWPADHPRVDLDAVGGAHRRLRPLLADAAPGSAPCSSGTACSSWSAGSSAARRCTATPTRSAP